MSSNHSVTEPLDRDRGVTDTSQSERVADAISASRNAFYEQQDAPSGDATLDLRGQINRADEIDDDEEFEIEEVVLAEEAAEEEETAEEPVEENHSGLQPTLDFTATEESVAQETDDLADYMESFLKRMKCSSGQNDELIEAAEPVVAEQPKEPESSYSGPKAAPERASDLQAMREVANASVKDSLSRHDQFLVQQTRVALLIAFVASILSGLMAWLATEVMGYAFIASVVCFGVAAFSACCYWAGLKRLKQSEAPNPAGTTAHPAA